MYSWIYFVVLLRLSPLRNQMKKKLPPNMAERLYWMPQNGTESDE